MKILDSQNPIQPLTVQFTQNELNALLTALNSTDVANVLEKSFGKDPFGDEWDKFREELEERGAKFVRPTE